MSRLSKVEKLKSFQNTSLEKEFFLNEITIILGTTFLSQHHLNDQK